AARGLDVGEPLLHGGDRGAALLEPFVEALLPFGLLRAGPLGRPGRGIQALQVDEAFDISFHGRVQRQKKPRRLRTGAWRGDVSPRAVSVVIRKSIISIRLHLRVGLPTEARAQARAKVGPPGFEPGTGRL